MKKTGDFDSIQSKPPVSLCQLADHIEKRLQVTAAELDLLIRQMPSTYLKCQGIIVSFAIP